MNSVRLEQLLKFLDESPDDPFILYALALEYTSSNPELALQYFTALLNNHPDYLPTYYQAAQFYEQIDQKEKALALYSKGIELATLQQDLSTRKELQAALELLREDDL
jgi:tetratricopeptide (TPR) repeat protein